MRLFCWMCGRGESGWPVCSSTGGVGPGCWSGEAFTPGPARPGRRRATHLLSSCPPLPQTTVPRHVRPDRELQMPCPQHTPGLRPSAPDQPAPAGKRGDWTGSSCRRWDRYRSRAWDTVWAPRTGCAVSEVPTACPRSGLDDPGSRVLVEAEDGFLDLSASHIRVGELGVGNVAAAPDTVWHLKTPPARYGGWSSASSWSGRPSGSFPWPNRPAHTGGLRANLPSRVLPVRLRVRRQRKSGCARCRSVRLQGSPRRRRTSPREPC